LYAFSFRIERENSFLSITTPLSEGEAFNEASFTSPALSPKMARSSFSSGEGSDSPLGVIFPIRISPGLISAPIRMIRFHPDFGCFFAYIWNIRVNSSNPRFVSRTSRNIHQYE
jgi:hypothetical protein